MLTTVTCSSHIISGQISSLLIMNTSCETLGLNIIAAQKCYLFAKLVTESITPCKAANPSFTGKT